MSCVLLSVLFAMEAEMNRMYEQMGDATPEEMERLLAETGTYQELLEQHDFYMIDTKVDEIARALGLEELGLDRDVTDLSGGQRTRVLMAKLLLENQTSCFWTSRPTIWMSSTLNG